MHARNGEGQRDGPPLSVAPNLLSVAYWERLLGGELYALLSRVDWPTPLRPALGVAVKRCTACAGRMTVRAAVTHPAFNVNELKSTYES